MLVSFRFFQFAFSLCFVWFVFVLFFVSVSFKQSKPQCCIGLFKLVAIHLLTTIFNHGDCMSEAAEFPHPWAWISLSGVAPLCRKRLRDGLERTIMGLSERIDAILN